MATALATDALHRAVSSLLREVAAEVVMPRFGHLTAGDITEKAPEDLVTIADREAEQRLTDGLRAVLPDASVVGEEASAADPSLPDRVGEGLVWIIDPIDGTANYAAGRSPFALMVALIADGVTQGAWILDPVTGRLCHAVDGGGAFIDGARVIARGSGARLPLGALATRFLPPAIGAAIAERAAGRIEPVPVPGCAGEQYPRVVLGEADIALYWRTLPWDHAPGALFLTAAGGRIARPDGTPYRVADRREMLLAAATPALWHAAAAILFAAPLPVA